MKDTSHHDERVAQMKFSSVYPHYLDRILRRGRTKEELHQVIEWLTGYNSQKLEELIKSEVTFETFYTEAKMHPNVDLIKGVVCGYRIEEIQNTLTRQTRYLDKLIDELAKGRKMEKILRVK